MQVDKGVDRGVEGEGRRGDRGRRVRFHCIVLLPPTHQTSLPFFIIKIQ